MNVYRGRDAVIPDKISPLVTKDGRKGVRIMSILSGLSNDQRQEKKEISKR
jgi:hypothetical protein